VFDGGEDAGGFAFEWTVAGRAGGTCIVRLVQTGFGSGQDWDDQYDAMSGGWQLFLRNLQLHLLHFHGQTATASLPMAMWPGPRERAWAALTRHLGIPVAPSVGDRIRTSAGEAAGDAPTLEGTVVDAASCRLVLLVDQPAPGTALIAAEGAGEQVTVSVWTYLYGSEGAVAATRDEPRWANWLAAGAQGIGED
jgi:hypothetical protein